MNYLASYWQDFGSWYAQPYSGGQNMSVVSWFLFIGLILVILIGWGIIIGYVQRFAE